MRNKLYKNILIMNLRKIGDTIMATSAAYLLKKAYPKAKITMMVTPVTQSIVKNNPVIDDLLIYDYSHKVKISDIKATAKILKSKNFDLAIMLDYKHRSAILTWLAGIPERVGFERITRRNIYLKLFYTHIYKIDYDFYATLQVKNHEIFINRITGRNDTAKMIMPQISSESKKNVDRLLSTFGHDSLKIALCIRSGAVSKDYPRDKFLQVIKSLANKYHNINFYIVGTETDCKYANEFISDSQLYIENFCGKTNLPELGYLLNRTDFLLTVDTGTAHIAAAVDTREVVVFVGTPPQRWTPYSDKAIAVYPEISYDPQQNRKKKKTLSYEHLSFVEPEKIINTCNASIDILIGNTDNN